MKQYLDTLRNIKENGHDHPDRTKVGRRTITGVMTRFNLQDGFPMVTTRSVPTKNFINETLWFISGSTDAQKLRDMGVNIWNLWAVEEKHIDAFVEKHQDMFKKAEMSEGDIELFRQELTSRYLNQIGPMYGAMWRNAPRSGRFNLLPAIEISDLASDKVAAYIADYEQEYRGAAEKPSLEEYMSWRSTETIDQLQQVIVSLKKRPYSSRHIVTAWVPEFISDETISPQENVLCGLGSLAPCHAMFQFFVIGPASEGERPRLSLMMTQRSADFPIGSATNIPQYALLLAMVAQVVDMEPYEFIYSMGDCHIYFNQLPFIDEQLAREPRPLPKLVLNPEIKDLYKFTASDIAIEDYDPHPAIKYPISV